MRRAECHRLRPSPMIDFNWQGRVVRAARILVVDGHHLGFGLDAGHLLSGVSLPENWDRGVPKIGDWFIEDDGQCSIVPAAEFERENIDPGLAW